VAGGDTYHATFEETSDEVCVSMIELNLLGNWLQLFTAFLPALAIMILLSNVAEEIGWTGFVFAGSKIVNGPLRAALLTGVFFWLLHVPSVYVETRSWATTALVLGIFLLPIWAADSSPGGSTTAPDLAC
jgi:membrane protease YdiL (CAAX protease family)